MSPQDVALELIKRRIVGQSDIPKAQAFVEAHLLSRYELEPLIDYFDPTVGLLIRDESGKLINAVAVDQDPFLVPVDRLAAADVIVFGTPNDNGCDLLGWLDTESMAGSPLREIGRQHEVSPAFLLPMPYFFEFVLPDLDVLKVWSYVHEGWWTSLGFFRYDPTSANLIAQIDAKLSE